MTAPAYEISVVIPVRDGAAYLREALESVLAQTDPPCEIVVVDDGSTDGSATLAEGMGPHVRVVRQPPSGAGPARNRGVAEATSPWIAFLDADDRWRPEKLRVQAAALAADPSAVASIGSVRQFFCPVLGRTDRPSPEVLRGAIPSALLVRRDVFLATGGFPSRPGVEFAAWWIRFLEGKPGLAVVPEVVAERRIHGRNGGVLLPGARGAYVRVLKEALDRRRATEGAP